MTQRSAVVVGSGPNGLSAAVALAQAGLRVTVLEAAEEIGGGTRTAELTLPGIRHDICSAVHPLGIASPFLASLPLAEHGLEWRHPEIALAHPLDDGSAALLHRDLEQTCAGLGEDGAAWRRSFAPLLPGVDDLLDEVLRPLVHVPRHPVRLARFGLRAGLPATWFARRFRTPAARALFAGSAAHSYTPLTAPASAAVGVMLTLAGHASGWPVAAGGSAAITRALASLLESLGGEIHTGVRVTSMAQLPPADVVLLDLTPTAALELLDDRLPAGPARAYRRWRYGPAAFKLDLVVRGGVPWTAPQVRRAGTVHVGGTLEQIAAAEASVAAGRMPPDPFVLVAQQAVADPLRLGEDPDLQPVWVYGHVPHAHAEDATDAVLDQVERFAPGLRARIVATATHTPADYAAHNANYRGGDIAGGANDLVQLVARPRLRDPYATGVDGVYLCSSSTPPGAGVHGMCGLRAARRALAGLGA
ncbi:phytoene desaturase family protein [Nocardioides sp.]|uniref:phytoene desaturase family protein n=1 Tax=Nocardioides sp. TaxID=35761 RepID=UPI00351837F4